MSAFLKASLVGQKVCFHVATASLIICCILLAGAEGETSEMTGLPGVSKIPHINSSINLNPEEKQQCYEKVSSKSQEMMYKFQNLFSATRKSLRREMVTATALIQHLECLGSIMPTFKDTGLSPLRHRRSELAKLENVDDVMSVVKDYCSFFNYHMLEHIINEFGTSLDQENLAAYKKDFEIYAQCCVIKRPLEVGKMIEKGFSNMFVTLDDSFNDCTLSHIYVFVNNIRKALNISSDVTLKLCFITLGSMKLTFQLPHFMQQDLFPLSPKQEQSLAELGVVDLSCGDYQFTRQGNIKVS